MKPINEWTANDLLELVKSVDKKTWIRIGAGVVGLAVFVVFLGIPAWVSRFQVHGKISSIETQIKNTEGLNARQGELTKAKETHLVYMKESTERLFKPGETSLLLGMISKLANESKVSIIASSPKEAVEEFPKPFGDFYESALFDFTMEGGYHELGGLVARIETHPKMFRIQNLQILPNQTPGKESSHIINMTIKAVSIREPRKQTDEESGKGKKGKKGKKDKKSAKSKKEKKD